MAARATLSCLCLVVVAGPHPGALVIPGRMQYAPTALAPTSAPPSLSGRVVKFARNGYEPDGDPVDRVIIAAGLHGQGVRDGRGQLPAMTLVLSTYLENFQSANVPILPDLLRRDVTATSLGGFMQGKAALVDGAGRVRYRGGVLAEVFLDNDVHMVVDMDPQGLPAATAPLRLSGAFTLHRDLTLTGAMDASRPLSPAEAAALRVAHPRAVSWQAVVGGLHVRYPKMMGTSGSGVVPGAPTTSASSQARAMTPTALRQGQAPLSTVPVGSLPVAAGAQSGPTHGAGGPSLLMLWGGLGAAALALAGIVLTVRARVSKRGRPS